MQSSQAELKTVRVEPTLSSQDTEENPSGLVPLGHAVLVRTYEPELRSSVIHIPEGAANRMQMVEQRCVVVAVGSECWKDEANPRCGPGDRVLVTKFAGYQTTQSKDGLSYRLVNDRDIFAKITWE